MNKHPHIYIPDELKTDDKVIQFAEEFIAKKTEPSLEERLEALETIELERILGGM